MGAVLALMFVFGLYLRLWILGHETLNSDQAIVGLMAKDILNGHFSAFYWGQTYGGVEPYVTAFLFSVFGASAWLVNATAALLALGATALVWRIALRISGSQWVALLTAAIAWSWPEVFVWNSSRTYGFRAVVIDCGLILLLTVLRVISDDAGLWTWVAMGGALGLGWWASPEILYFAVPSGLVLIPWLVRSERAGTAGRVLVGRMVAGLATFVIGAFPWIWSNIHSGFASINQNLSSGPHETYLGRLHLFFTKVLPMLFGLRVEGSGAWLGNAELAKFLYVLALLLVSVAMCPTLTSPTARLIGISVLLYPFIYAALPPTSFWNDARYGILLTPMLCVVLVTGWYRLTLEGLRHSDAVPFASHRRALVSVGLTTVLAIMALFTFAAFVDTQPFSWNNTNIIANPNRGAQETVSALARQNIKASYGGYWVAYDLDFFSDGNITVASAEQVRSEAIQKRVSDAKHQAWLFSPNPQALAQFGGPPEPGPDGLTVESFSNLLREHAINFRLSNVGILEAVLPSARITPQWVHAIVGS